VKRGRLLAATALEGHSPRRDRDVAGAGNSAGQAAMYLSEARQSVAVVRGKSRISMSNYLSRRWRPARISRSLPDRDSENEPVAKMLEKVELEIPRRRKCVVETRQSFP